MNPDTLEIARVDSDPMGMRERLDETMKALEQQFSSAEELQKAGFTVPIPGAEFPAVQGMNRKQRRAWLKAQRKP